MRRSEERIETERKRDAHEQMQAFLVKGQGFMEKASPALDKGDIDAAIKYYEQSVVYNEKALPYANPEKIIAIRRHLDLQRKNLAQIVEIRNLRDQITKTEQAQKAKEAKELANKNEVYCNEIESNFRSHTNGPMKRYTGASRGKRWNGFDRIRQQGHSMRYNKHQRFPRKWRRCGSPNNSAANIARYFPGH